MLLSKENIEQPLLTYPSSWATIDDTNNSTSEQIQGVLPISSSSAKHENENKLPRTVVFMRLGNICAAAFVVFVSIGQLSSIFSPSTIVLACYEICFGSLICCLEVNLSFLQQTIATNFGFLYNPYLRLLFYALMAMVAWSFGSFLGYIACTVLIVLSVFNTFVLCRYSEYRAVLIEIAHQEERRIKMEINQELRNQAWRHTTLPSWLHDYV